jgi:hypothetical protein
MLFMLFFLNICLGFSTFYPMAVPPPNVIDANQQKCSICLQENGVLPTVVLKCSTVTHQFHKECLGDWFLLCARKKAHLTCPLCRNQASLEEVKETIGVIPDFGTVSISNNIARIVFQGWACIFGTANLLGGICNYFEPVCSVDNLKNFAVSTAIFASIWAYTRFHEPTLFSRRPFSWYKWVILASILLITADILTNHT